MCTLRLEEVLAAKLHCVHLCGFSPVWMRKCVFKWAAWLNDLLHWEQLCFFFPPWACLCLLRLLLLEKFLGHKSQDFRSAIFSLLSPPDVPPLPDSLSRWLRKWTWTLKIASGNFPLYKIIPSKMEVAPLHCTVDITQKRRLFKNTKETDSLPTSTDSLLTLYWLSTGLLQICHVSEQLKTAGNIQSFMKYGLDWITDHSQHVNTGFKLGARVKSD